MDELLRVNRDAVRATVDVVAAVRREDFDKPTPCGEWNLATLLAHMTAQHRGFAAAAAGRGADPEVWREHPVGDDPAADYAAAVDEVLAAFARDEVVDTEFALPDAGPGGSVPATLAINMHLVDYVVHGWDVAVSIGLPFEPGEEAARAALALAEQVPDGPDRLESHAPFGPAVDQPEGAGPLERTLALLGRRPDWQRPSTEAASAPGGNA